MALPRFQDSHLPPLKSKLNGASTLFSGSSIILDNSDTMSVNGSIVSNGSSTNISSNGLNSNLSNGHSNGVHINGMSTLPLMRPTTSESTRTSGLESPKTDSPQLNGIKDIYVKYLAPPPPRILLKYQQYLLSFKLPLKCTFGLHFVNVHLSSILFTNIWAPFF